MSSAGLDLIEGEQQSDPPSLEHREPLLKTKLYVPPVRPGGVTRPRLIVQIERSLDKALILICAPAGYGKTTLVSSWLHATGIASTWLSLDEDDNDPIRFLQYFITALQKIVPAIQPGLLGVLQDRQPASYKFLVNVLINEIAGCAAPFVLVLDDFHYLHAGPVLEILTHLLEHMPPHMHVVLLSRTDPPLPLSRLRVHNQLVELRAGQLRFTQAETAFFLNEVMGLELSGADIAALEARTEGWIAGLHLASLAMQSAASSARLASRTGKDAHAFVAAFTGSHTYIMDYLAEEVLKLQTERVRSFLLQSSILERMCGPLCDEVIGVPPAGLVVGGQEMLEALEQMNLFTIPLDSERRWYRYHHLFADVLNRQLEAQSPQILSDLHRRASRWYEQNGYISEAVQHARAAGDHDRTAQLVDQNGCLLLMRGEVTNLLKWIEAVEPRSQTFPWIAIQKGWALCLSGQPERAEAPLQTAEGLISALEPGDEMQTMRGAVRAARAYRANLLGQARLAADLARQALDCLPASSDFSCSLRSAATSILGDACWSEGNLVEAQRAYSNAVQISQAAGNIHMVIVTNSNLAELLLEQGQLRQAARIYADALQMATLPGGQISPLAEKVYAGLSRIAYEWNHLEDAATYVQQCLELSRRWGSFESQAIGHVVSAGLEQVRCNPEKAREDMHAAQQLLDEHPFTPRRSIILQSALARLWIAQGDLERASHLVQECGITVEGEISYLQEPVVLTRLHLHLARREYAAVLELSERLLKKPDGAKPAAWVIEILVLQALAFQGQRDMGQALASLEKACSLAQPEGYVRIFLDEGEPMAKLLYQARSHHMGGGYAAELLIGNSAALGDAFGSPLPPATLLIEPLTLRELEVLKLIEAGCSNQEIAARLVISMPTVKRHISNIYAKLGVSSRTQAVAHSRELELFK